MTDGGGFKITDRRTWTHDEDEKESSPKAEERIPVKEPLRKGKLVEEHHDHRSGSSPKEALVSPSGEPFVDVPPPAEDEEMAGGAEEGMEEIPGGAPPGVSLVSLPSVELANFFLGILLQKTYMNLGMIPGPDGPRPPPDFAEARRAIELIACLAAEMKGKWGEIGVEQELEAQLANIRLVYARVAPPEK